MKVKCQYRNGKEVVAGGVAVPAGGTVQDLIDAIFKAKKRLHPTRQRLSLPPAPEQTRGAVLEAGKKLSDYGLRDGSVVQVKDLGPQVSYRGVFFWEYFGPMVIYPLFFYFADKIYPALGLPAPELQQQQFLAMAYWVFHFAKRILETFFVHKFSNATMPVANLWRNCSHYWLAGAYVGYFINHPSYTAAPLAQVQALLAAALVCQLGNLTCHVMLARLRSGGKTGYQKPTGFLFDFIACPNYTCEIWGWLLFTAATRTLTAGVFALAGALPMIDWALKKYKRLRKQFGDDYPKRFVIFPPLL
ncbi:unnamed protein product [Pedinophyceae sp. YPF-701]|nr:unnamed protein product [Pedinophyceae sp. YPF-701]